MARRGGLLLAIIATTALAADTPQQAIPDQARRSGTTYLSPAMQAESRDLTVNPGMLWVERGSELWSKPEGSAAKSCASCHGAPEKMSGVATRYPQWDANAGRLLNLELRIQQCRNERQQGSQLQPESEELLALTALVAHQSRGQPIHVTIEGPARTIFEHGRQLYYQRQGQMNLSCAQCHEQSYGQRLRAETISQGQPTGFPIYRLEWQTMGSFLRRLRACYLGVRAEQPAFASADHLALELFLAWRADGLEVDTPAVRR